MSKITRKLALQLQSGSTYESDNMVQIPFIDGIINNRYDTLEDNSIVGFGFSDTPVQGNSSTTGEYSFNIDPISILPILNATIGSETYLVPGHTKKLSVVTHDNVQDLEYSNCYIKSFIISGNKNNNIVGNISLVSIDTPTVGIFPTIYSPTRCFTFQECTLLVGDHIDTLNNSDRISFDSFKLEIISGLDEVVDSESHWIEWGQVTPSIKFNFTVPKYQSTIWQDWNNTNLQLELLLYKSIAEQIKIQMPNIKIKSELKSDAITNVNIDCTLGRNGINGEYVNGNMRYVSPIRFGVGTPVPDINGVQIYTDLVNVILWQNKTDTDVTLYQDTTNV